MSDRLIRVEEKIMNRLHSNLHNLTPKQPAVLSFVGHASQR
jgi:hypothetical protein